MTTDDTLDGYDAIRALRDRPSMEHELQCLREEVERLRGALREIALQGDLGASTKWYMADIARSALAKMEGGGE